MSQHPARSHASRRCRTALFVSTVAFGIGAAGSSGCGTGTDTPFALDETSVAEVAAALTTGAPVALPAYGGSGGGASGPILCLPGYVATGIRVSMGDYINTIKLRCRKLRSDGSLGDDELTERAGDNKLDRVEIGCPSDQVLVQESIGVFANLYVGGVIGACAKLDRVRRCETNLDKTLSPLEGTAAPFLQYHTSQCPPGSAVVGFYGRFGDWTDQLGFLCAEVH
jgi:hypothetical protein